MILCREKGESLRNLNFVNESLVRDSICTCTQNSIRWDRMEFLSLQFRYEISFKSHID